MPQYAKQVTTPIRTRLATARNEITRGLEDREAAFQVLHQFPSLDVEQRWRAFLSRVDCPSCCDTPEYFAEPFREGRLPFAVLAFRDGEIEGVLTGVHQGKQMNCGLPSRPQICFDKAAETNFVSRVLYEGLLTEAGDAELIDVFSWGSRPLSFFEQQGFRAKKADSSVVLDLSLGANALFRQFHRNRVRNIRAAQDHGVEVYEADSEEDLRAFYAVHCQWKNTQRKRIHSNLTFAAAQRTQELTGTHRKFLARYKGSTIAAYCVRFCPGGLLEGSSSCALDQYLSLRANDLLIWKVVEWGCEQGFKKYSLGGAHLFLTKCGGEIVPIDRYRLDRTFLHRHDLEDSASNFGRRLLQKMPLPVSTTVKRILRRTMSVLHPAALIGLMITTA